MQTPDILIIAIPFACGAVGGFFAAVIGGAIAIRRGIRANHFRSIR
jgi:hypothetical protein